MLRRLDFPTAVLRGMAKESALLLSFSTNPNYTYGTIAKPCGWLGMLQELADGEAWEAGQSTVGKRPMRPLGRRGVEGCECGSWLGSRVARDVARVRHRPKRQLCQGARAAGERRYIFSVFFQNGRKMYRYIAAVDTHDATHECRGPCIRSPKHRIELGAARTGHGRPDETTCDALHGSASHRAAGRGRGENFSRSHPTQLYL